MDPWIVWLVVAALFAGGEVLTPSFWLLPFAGGAAAAAIAAAVGAGLVVTGPLFLVVSIVMLAGLRPVARRHLRSPPRTRSGTAALVGGEATVVRRVEGPERTGTVRLGGEEWSARASGEDEIEVGTRVLVLEIRGATAVVEALE